VRDRASAAAAAACLHDKHEDPEIELFAFDEQWPVDVAAGHNEYENKSIKRAKSSASSAALPASDGAAHVLHCGCSAGEYADVLAAAAVSRLANDCSAGSGP
jgi:hypothetical protein